MNPDDATQLLERVESGDIAAAEALLPLVYEELRARAGAHFRSQPASHTLQPTALVHEAYVKLVRGSGQEWKSRAHFCAVAATAMRQILMNHAEAKRAAKRGGGAKQVPLDQITSPSGRDTFDVVALDDALTRLHAADPDQGRVVELRFFGDLEVAQIAEVMDVSTRTVERTWRRARAWLSSELSGAAS